MLVLVKCYDNKIVKATPHLFHPYVVSQLRKITNNNNKKKSLVNPTQFFRVCVGVGAGVEQTDQDRQTNKHSHSHTFTHTRRERERTGVRDVEQKSYKICAIGKNEP